MAGFLIITVAFMPYPAFTQSQTINLSVDQSSTVMASPTYSISVISSPVTDLWQIRFTVIFNDDIDFLEVPGGGVEIDDLFTGLQPSLSTGEYQIGGLSYLEVLIEMPGNDTITTSESKSLAKVTFRLLDNAMPGMASCLNLTWADATFFTGEEIPFEYIDSTGGITLESGHVTLDYLVTTLTVNSATANVEEPATLSSILRGGDGTPVPDQNVDYYVDSLAIGSAVTDEFGISSIQYTPSEVGTFDVTAEYTGNQPGGKYASSSGTAVLVVDKRNTTLNLSVKPSIKVNEVVDLAATLMKDGTPMGGETVRFQVNSTEVGSQVTDVSGLASMQYNFSSPGKYIIEAEYSGTTEYAPSSASTTRTVGGTRTSLVLTVTPIITKVHQDVMLSATLKDESDFPLAGRTIEYYVNEDFVGSSSTNDNGLSSMTYTPLEASIPEGWTIEARFGGDSTYSSTVDTASLVVNGLLTVLELDMEPTTVTIEQTVTMTATLIDENTNAIAGSEIYYYVKIDDKWTKIGNATTDQNGSASLIYETTTTGNLVVKAEYVGSSTYIASSSEPKMMNVNKLATTLDLNMPTITKIEQTIMISAILTDENGKSIPATTIAYSKLTDSIEEQIGSAKTNNEGIASMPYTSPNSTGKFQIKATYAEDTKYLGSTASKELIVNPFTTNITLSVAETTNVGATVTLLATLQHENGEALENLTIEYYISSGGLATKIGTALTNSSGIATADFTPSESGKFFIKAVFNGHPKYSQSISEELTLEVVDRRFQIIDLLPWWLLIGAFVMCVFLIMLKSRNRFEGAHSTSARLKTQTTKTESKIRRAAKKIKAKTKPKNLKQAWEMALQETEYENE